MKLKTIIIEDEAPARRRIERLVDDHRNLECIASLSNGHEVINKLDSLNYDLILMDIELKDKNSFEILETLSIDSNKVIFITAFDHYAISAFEISVSDYLLKPFSNERFNNAISKFIEKNKYFTDTDISIDEGNKTYFFSSTNIILISSNQHYIEIIEFNKKTTIRYPISKLSTKLSKNFVRVNKSTIINLNKVKSSKKNKSHMLFTLVNNTIIKSSNVYYKL